MRDYGQTRNSAAHFNLRVCTKKVFYFAKKSNLRLIRSPRTVDVPSTRTRVVPSPHVNIKLTVWTDQMVENKWP